LKLAKRVGFVVVVSIALSVIFWAAYGSFVGGP